MNVVPFMRAQIVRSQWVFTMRARFDQIDEARIGKNHFFSSQKWYLFRTIIIIVEWNGLWYCVIVYWLIFLHSSEFPIEFGTSGSELIALHSWCWCSQTQNSSIHNSTWKMNWNCVYESGMKGNIPTKTDWA